MVGVINPVSLVQMHTGVDSIGGGAMLITGLLITTVLLKNVEIQEILAASFAVGAGEISVQHALQTWR